MEAIATWASHLGVSSYRARGPGGSAPLIRGGSTRPVRIPSEPPKRANEVLVARLHPPRTGMKSYPILASVPDPLSRPGCSVPAGTEPGTRERVWDRFPARNDHPLARSISGNPRIARLFISRRVFVRQRYLRQS